MIDNQEDGWVVLSESLGYQSVLGLVRQEHGGIVEIETFDDDGNCCHPL